MKLTINATQDGTEIATALVNQVKDAHGIKSDEGTYTVKCIVLNKKDEPVEIALDKVKFVYERN